MFLMMIIIIINVLLNTDSYIINFVHLESYVMLTDW